MRGTFVAIEGVDSSGKSTQVALLTELFKRTGVPYRYIHFPRTEKPGYGEAISMFLRGEFGTVKDVNPYLVALLFAGDRADAKDEISNWLDSGFFVITDRYLYSNLAFQGAKLANADEKHKFREWLNYIELQCHRIPAPNLSLYLSVPTAFVVSKSRERQRYESRAYLNGREDIHEIDPELQVRVAEEYRDLVRSSENLTAIDCWADGQMDSPEAIHHRIVGELNERQMLPRTVAKSRLGGDR